MNYFKDCKSIEEIKKLYRKLAQQFHPDHGGDEETMKQINLQYEQQKGRKFTATNHETNKTYEQTFDPFDGYRELIDALLNIPGITIELCGCWLWVGGVKKEDKEKQTILKELKFTYSAKKNMWYWKPGTYRKKSKKELTIEEIRNLYGSNRVQREEQQTEQRQAIAV